MAQCGPLWHISSAVGVARGDLKWPIHFLDVAQCGTFFQKQKSSILIFKEWHSFTLCGTFFSVKVARFEIVISQHCSKYCEHHRHVKRFCKDCTLILNFVYMRSQRLAHPLGKWDKGSVLRSKFICSHTSDLFRSMFNSVEC